MFHCYETQQPFHSLSSGSFDFEIENEIEIEFKQDNGKIQRYQIDRIRSSLFSELFRISQSFEISRCHTQIKCLGFIKKKYGTILLKLLRFNTPPSSSNRIEIFFPISLSCDEKLIRVEN